MRESEEKRQHQAPSALFGIVSRGKLPRSIEGRMTDSGVGHSGHRPVEDGRGDGVNVIDQGKVYKSEQTKMDAPFRIRVLCSESGSFCCESSSRFIPGAAVRRPGSHRETPFRNYGGDAGTYDHCGKRRMEEFLVGARFAVG
jgi:hypothetical protein